MIEIRWVGELLWLEAPEEEAFDPPLELRERLRDDNRGPAASGFALRKLRTFPRLN
jgi:hypothetical protein